MAQGLASHITLSAARVSNFRSLKDVEVELNEFTLLVGANNSGKTSFLDALYGAIGAGRRGLGKEDIYLVADESDVPKDRTSVIDILLRPTDDDGQVIDKFPAGDYWTNLFGDGISQDPIDFHDFVSIRTTVGWSSAQADYRVLRKFLKEWKPFDSWLSADEKDFRSECPD
jgi:putative ATP-dependent endonuclease of the OLD family